MATHASAKKRHRQSLQRQARNRHVRSTVRRAIREVRKATAEGVDAEPKLARAEKLLRRAGSKGVFHAKTVSRTISRLARHVRRST